MRTPTQGRDNKHEPKSLERTGRPIKGFGLSGGRGGGAPGAKKLSSIILLKAAPLKCMILMCVHHRVFRIQLTEK